ncbi:hypothetical protein EV127DRAFT_11703 [Xylaria flabelliformis]|nr:hypothetical protein EV127DRAFT_11703 [Xylaria flabelliformis]
MSTAPGWAIRRNSSCILTQEVDCGETANGYRACCPSSTTCPSQYNVACCPASTNCTAAIVETPSCANSSWIMFDNAGYFCCESGQVGYNLRNTDGCSKSGKALPANANPLAVVSQMFPSTSTSSTSTSSSSTPTSTASTSPSPTTSSDTTNAMTGGTIAGAVVGGVAGIAILASLVWFFIRKRKSTSVTGERQQEAPQAHESRYDGNQYKGYYAMPLENPSEIGGTPKAELPVPFDRTEGRSEMP